MKENAGRGERGDAMGDMSSVDFREQLVEACEKIGQAFEEMESKIREDCERLKEAFKKVIQRVAEAFTEIKEEIEALDVDDDEKAFEAQERRWARLLAAQRAAARLKAYGLRMLLEKARRALRRRKRLHDDGGVPDGERQVIR